MNSGALLSKVLFVSAISCSLLDLKRALDILSMPPSASDARTETAERKGLQGETIHVS